MGDSHFFLQWMARTHNKTTWVTTNSGAITNLTKDIWAISQVISKILICIKWCLIWTLNTIKWWCKTICKINSMDKPLGNTQCQWTIHIIWISRCKEAECICKINMEIWCIMINRIRECKGNHKGKINWRAKRVISLEMGVPRDSTRLLVKAVSRLSSNQRVSF